MILATGQTLEILLAGAVAANQSPVVVDYVDILGTDMTPGSSAVLTNSTTPVTICVAPTGSTKRKINLVSVVNIDTAAITATVRVNAGSTYDLVKVTIPVGGTLTFNDRTGWRVITQFGGTPDLRQGWVQEFRESGTWYKPSGCRFFLVEACGAGGGGQAGGGYQGSLAGGVAGGAGGGGGCRIRRLFLASDLPASVAVTVAPQSNGGTPVANARGGDGAQGGNSSFGTYVIGYGGGPGGWTGTVSSGGSGGGGTGAGYHPSITSYGGEAMAQAIGGWPDYRGGASRFNGGGYDSFFGGGGSGIANGGNSYFSAGGGTSGSGLGAGTAGPQAIWPPGVSGQIPLGSGYYFGVAGTDGMTGPRFPGYAGCGGYAGMAASRNGAVNGGRGGDGGWPGGGGGGGGAAQSIDSGTATGGAGGRGGAGMVRVMGW